MRSYQQQSRSVSTRLLFQIFLACLTEGVRKPGLLKALDITEARLRDPMGHMDSKLLDILLAKVAAETRDNNIALRLGKRMLPRAFSNDQYPSMYASSLREVLREIITGLNERLGWEPLELKVDGRRQCVLWKGGRFDNPALIELVFSEICHLASSLTASQFPAIKAVHFSHSRFVAATDGQDYLPVSPAFGHGINAIEFQNHWLELPNPKARLDLIAAAKQQLASIRKLGSAGKPTTCYTYFYLFPLLDKCGLSLEAQSQTLGIAERTLRRKLVAEGSSFRQVLEMVRRDACHLYFMEGTRLLSEIATKLGYSELSAFTRAYTSWYGHPPSQDMIDHRAEAA